MEKWEIVLKLRFGGLFWPVKQGFSFEWKAWLLAYETTECGPDEFNALDGERQIAALAYGAACWWSMKHRKKVFFTMENIADALMRATKADNLALASALREAQFPLWMRAMSEDKKKAEEA